MRIVTVAVVLFFAAAARADDTKPPQISEVRATLKGGQVQVEARITDETGVLSAICHHRGAAGRVEDSPMVKNDFDDVFRATFAGGPDTEYWIEASDLLGNGPATYGSSAKAFAVGSAAPSEKIARGQRPARKPPEAKPPEPKPPPERVTAKVSLAPSVEHSRPSTSPPEGRDFLVRTKIRSESPVEKAVLQVRPQGTTTFTNMPLTRTDAETWEAQIPAAMAHGNVEYFITARNAAGQATRQGEGGLRSPYVIAFKTTATASPATASPATASPATATAASAAAPQATGPFIFTDNPPVRVPPGRPFVLRAQVVPPTDNGEMPDRVAILWRGNDAQDQLTDMVRDETGGWGGYKAELPPQDEGAIFFQIVACDATASKCGIDTGSKRKWHAAVIAAQPGTPRPLPLDAVSTKAPPILPE